MKDIIKNDKVVEDIQMLKKKVRRILEIEKEIISMELMDTHESVEDAVRGLYREKDRLEAELKISYGNGTSEPTTDIDEVRRKFKQAMSDEEYGDAFGIDDDKVFDFFLPYLKGGE